MGRKPSKNLRYAVYDKDHLNIGNAVTRARAERLFRKPNARMLASLQPSTRTFSGLAIKKVLKRKP